MEKGRNHLLDPDDLTKPAGDYSNDEIKFISRHFLGPDPLIEPRTFRRSADEGEHTHVGEVNSIPTTVGGGGTHADGKVPRFREEDFAPLLHLRAAGGRRGRRLAARLRRARAVLRRGRAGHRRGGPRAGANPFAAWRSGPYPMPPGAPMYGAVLSSAAAEKVGPAPLRGAHGGQQRRLRRPPGLQQLRLLRLLRLPHPRQGRPRGAPDQGHGDGPGRAAGRDVSCQPDRHRRAAGHRGRVHRPRRRRRTSMDADMVIVAGGAIETPRSCSCSRASTTRPSAAT